MPKIEKRVEKVETWDINLGVETPDDGDVRPNTGRSKFTKRNPGISAKKGKEVSLQKVLQMLSKPSLTDLEIDEICKFVSELTRRLCLIRSSLIQQRPHGPEISNAESDIGKLLPKFDLECIKSASRSDIARIQTCISNVNLIKAELGLKPTELTREVVKTKKFKRGVEKKTAEIVKEVSQNEAEDSGSDTPDNWDDSSSDDSDEAI